MKKILLLSTILTFFLTSCFNSVFYNILQDVPPEKATVSGIIDAISRYSVGDKEFLVLSANDGIRYKLADKEDKTEWTVYKNLPFQLHSFDYGSSEHKGEYIIKVLADSKYLYILSTTYILDEDLQLSCPDIVSVYAKEISLEGDLWKEEGEWTKVMSGKDYFKFSVKNDYVYSDFNVFSTNSIKKEHRKAFIRLGNTESYTSAHKTLKYFELNGTSEPLEYTPEVLEEDDNNKNLNSAVYFNGKYLFFNAIASVTNETQDKEADFIYYGKNKELKYYTTAEGIKTAIENCGSPISCLAPCSNALLIGRGDFSDEIKYTTGGITKTTLTNGVPGDKRTDFETNAHIQLSESYYILTLINTDPTKSELQSTLYASVAFVGAGSNATAGVNYKNIGLWSYYPSRGNWNRE